MKNRIPMHWTLSRRWRKGLFWGSLTTITIAICGLLALLQGGREAVVSLGENIIASALVGIVLLLFLGKWLQQNAFFPWSEVSSFLRRRKPSSKEMAQYESERYMDILGKIEDHLGKYRQKKVFSFLLMGPEQSGKTCFTKYINVTRRWRRKYLALEVPYAVVANNPAALDEVFHWLCDGDEGDRLRCRLIVFHAGNSVRQVNELVEKMKIVRERFRKIDATETKRHPILLIVQFTGRRPLEAISSDLDWNDVLDDVFSLNYIAPDWIAKEYARKREKNGKAVDPDFARQLYLHSLGVPEWYHALSDAETEDDLFLARYAYLERWFPAKDDKGQAHGFWGGILRVRCEDMLPFRFLANTFLLEKAYGRDTAESSLSVRWSKFLREELPEMDLVDGRAAVKACGERFFGPLSESFLLYYGFLPTVFRSGKDLEQRPVREILEEMIGFFMWGNDDADKTDRDDNIDKKEPTDLNKLYLRRRLLLEFGFYFQRYIAHGGVRIDKAEAKLKSCVLECVDAIINERDADFAEPTLALMFFMNFDGPRISELEKLSDPTIVKLLSILREGSGGKPSAPEWAARFLKFASVCGDTFLNWLPPMAETLFLHAAHKLYQTFMETKSEELPCFHMLEQCIRVFRRLACRSQDTFLINKLVELETLRLSFAKPIRYDDVNGIVNEHLAKKYAFFYDSKDFLQCRSWLRKNLFSKNLAVKSKKMTLSLPEYDDGWQTILHRSELWMANHAVQQVFLLAKYNHEIPWEKVRIILEDLMLRLDWYRNYMESARESLPIVFANELLFAQINFLTYRELVRRDPPNGEWTKLDLDPKTERAVVEFCEEELVKAQRKVWGPMPTNPQERRRADAFCGCRLVKYLMVAFRRGLMADGRRLIRLSDIPADTLPGSVLFQGKFPERDEFIGAVLDIERSLEGGDGATVRFLQASLKPEEKKGA